MREGPDNEAAAVVEATAFRARAPAGSLHDLACPCGVSAQSPPCISCRGFLRPTCGSGGDADDDWNSPMLPPESSRRGAQRPLKYWHVRYSAAASNMVCVCAWPCSVSA